MLNSAPFFGTLDTPVEGNAYSLTQIANAVWSSADRSLTAPAGLTTAEHNHLMALTSGTSGGLTLEEHNHLMALTSGPASSGLTLEEHNHLMSLVNGGGTGGGGLTAEQVAHLMAIPLGTPGLTTQQHNKLMAIPTADDTAAAVWNRPLK